ncbi:hypothetical protein JTB14_012189 [Gonioctena quinquepunctata]|nr:hypothetical protein JTB14_012189 [Gonioctena quinquepunctata]
MHEFVQIILYQDEVDEAGNTALIIEPTAGQSTEALETPELCNEHESRRTANIQTDLSMDHLNKLFGDLDFANQKN